MKTICNSWKLLHEYMYGEQLCLMSKVHDLFIGKELGKKPTKEGSNYIHYFESGETCSRFRKTRKPRSLF